MVIKDGANRLRGLSIYKDFDKLEYFSQNDGHVRENEDESHPAEDQFAVEGVDCALCVGAVLTHLREEDKGVYE